MQEDDEYDVDNSRRKKTTMRSTRSHGSKMNLSAHGSRKNLNQSNHSLSSMASEHNLEGMNASGGSGGGVGLGTSRKTPLGASTRTPRLQPFHLASSQTYASSGSGVIDAIYTADTSPSRRRSLTNSVSTRRESLGVSSKGNNSPSTKARPSRLSLKRPGNVNEQTLSHHTFSTPSATLHTSISSSTTFPLSSLIPR